MKIFIGITQDVDEIEQLVLLKNGEITSVTELGPFLSKDEALKWLRYLQSKISDIEEVCTKGKFLKEAGWYGFTFEQDRAKSE